ncbi:MAG: hypothetical protein WBL67_11300, partial [Nitrososphaeraceae archaeon]
MITFILILSLSMSGVFASVSTPVISLYATTESPTEDNEKSPNTTEDNEESPNTTDENVPEADDNQPDNTLPEPPDGAEPCPVGQITNPQTGECETSSPPPTNVNNDIVPNNAVSNSTVPNNAVSNNTVPNNTAPIINGNCNAVAISEGVNASSAAAASVTCINQQ